MYFELNGLRNIGCRVSDRVNFYSSELQNKENDELLKALETELFAAFPETEEAGIRKERN